MISRENIKQAYLFLKRNTYHENLNLFLKQRVAAFECDDFDASIDTIHEVLTSKEPLKHKQFKDWLSRIDYHLLPKSVSRPEDEVQKKHNENKGLFISNVSISPVYEVSKVNYLIDAPVEFHIIEVLWSLIVGPVLENNLTDDCYSNRLHTSALCFADNLEKTERNTTFSIFKRYVEQYSSWRDKAIDCATELANKDEDVALLSLDLKSYYYHIKSNFFKIRKLIKKEINDSEINSLALLLTQILKKVFSRYHQVLAPTLNITHPDCQEKSGLPIGFVSSSIISNWYLSAFDNEISDIVRPAYYGRYVDDILMVFKRAKVDSSNPIDSFVKHYLKGFVKYVSAENHYEITVDGNNLPIQHDKLILQFFDKSHSRAGLEVFKHELEERSSAFRFLPDDHMEKELDTFAYDILYEGSANKLRSVVGLAENEPELKKFLSSHIIAHRLCKLDKDDIVLPQLEVFFRGANILRFSGLWEKVYQYAVILNRPRFVIKFYRAIEEEIAKITYISDVDVDGVIENIKKKIHQDMKLYNKLALSLCVGLLDKKNYKHLTSGDLSEITIKSIEDLLNLPLNMFISPKLTGLSYFTHDQNLNSIIRNFRKANLIRHHLVAWPLANFTDYSGDLTDEEAFRNTFKGKLNKNKINLSPRFIHFDEFQLFALNNSLGSSGELLDKFLNKAIDQYENNPTQQEEFPVKFKSSSNIKKSKKKRKLNVSSLNVGSKSGGKNKLRIALANLRIDLEDIEASIRKDKKPNVTFERQSQLFRLLNDSIREKADLLILPEVSIPVSWLPFMVAHARRHQLGIVFGLELWNKKRVVYNLLIEALPFKVSGKYKSCVVTARIKNHYAPAELELIESLRLKPAKKANSASSYHKVHWNGVCFATYNCFELSDIKHRTLFKSEIDLLVACVWNKDTNYYQHILESAVRDIHCYVAQSNTQQYGGSCVLRPTETVRKTMLYVKGGNNSCVLTSDIDIKALRGFQFKSKPSRDKSFKILPPGYNNKNVLKR